jgi:hypothetical protein
MSLKDLYEADEPAWLEESLRLIRQKDYAELDFVNLVDFLESALNRTRREVSSRLRSLMPLLLKKELKDWMDDNWRGAVRVQRYHLQELLECPSLREYAKTVLATAYDRAVELAAAETDMEESCFPDVCPFTIDGLLADERGDTAG